MKNKYQRMNKEEKKDLKLKYKESERGQALLPRLNRLIVIAVLCYITTGVLIYLQNTDYKTTLNIVFAVLLIIFGTVFLFGSLNIRGKEYNKFALKQPAKSTNKKK